MNKPIKIASLGLLLFTIAACAQTEHVVTPPPAVPAVVAPNTHATVQTLTGESFGYRAAQPAPPVPVVQVQSGQDDEDDYWHYLNYLKMNSWTLYGSGAAGDTGANGNPLSVLNPPVDPK